MCKSFNLYTPNLSIVVQLQTPRAGRGSFVTVLMHEAKPYPKPLHSNVNHNTMIPGPLSPWLGELTSLKVLLLDGNRLSGRLPKTIQHLQGLKVHSPGSIASFLCELSSW